MIWPCCTRAFHGSVSNAGNARARPQCGPNVTSSLGPKSCFAPACPGFSACLMAWRALILSHSRLSLLTPFWLTQSPPQIRLLLVQSLVLLTSTRRARDEMRARTWFYPVLREYHRWERDERTSDEVYRVVEMLIRDEGPLPLPTAPAAPAGTAELTPDELAEIEAIQAAAEAARREQDAGPATASLSVATAPATAAAPPAAAPPPAGGAPLGPSTATHGPAELDAEDAAIVASLPQKPPRPAATAGDTPAAPSFDAAMDAALRALPPPTALPESERARTTIEVRIADTPPVVPLPLSLPEVATAPVPAPEQAVTEKQDVTTAAAEVAVRAAAPAKEVTSEGAITSGAVYDGLD